MFFHLLTLGSGLSTRPRLHLPAHTLVRASPVFLKAAASPDTDTTQDWAGLPAAIKASKCGAINHQIMQKKDFGDLLEYVSQKEKELNTVNIATAIHRLAVQTKRDRPNRDKLLRDPRFVALLDDAMERAAQLNPRSVSDIIWGCAAMQHWPATMLKPMLTQVAVHLKNSAFEPHHLSIIVWSLAVLKCKPTILLDQIELQAIPQLGLFSMQNCANLIWGYAKLNHKGSGKLLPAISDAVQRPGLLSQSKPVEVSDLAFAVAILGSAEENGELLRLLAARASSGQILDQFTSRQLVTMLWAFARLNLPPPDDSLERWLSIIQQSHETRPLLDLDQRNLRRAAEALGRNVDWLDKEPEEGEGVEVAASDISNTT
ncbi:hypothetical protein AB1Y20_023027 [Prymnesium parvum]|uniref:RNA-editing substrate-binding complex 6 protein domain-containing protein n=1 Tax=Prymnesium parvum TaxID=97485 RepID=A0AB34JFH8_PRYPA|mmetsp:Transcript_26292/g.65110  ORF Transcript_26292/g.65110 Transcript_26292/m.65110 type:complete len:373 (+) Transcript_26292:293-1411(+)